MNFSEFLRRFSILLLKENEEKQTILDEKQVFILCCYYNMYMYKVKVCQVLQKQPLYILSIKILIIPSKCALKNTKILLSM